MKQFGKHDGASRDQRFYFWDHFLPVDQTPDLIDSTRGGGVGRNSRTAVGC